MPVGLPHAAKALKIFTDPVTADRLPTASEHAWIYGPGHGEPWAVVGEASCCAATTSSRSTFGTASMKTADTWISSSSLRDGSSRRDSEAGASAPITVSS